ncbi:MAG: hypothetical protein VX615_03215 [Planctomycetota bacterium]|nr:hypothetical protein [Planctomycetota bacterium]
MPVAPRFLTAELSGLAEQIARAPQHVKEQQLSKLESFLFELEEDRLYPYDFVVYKVSGFRLEDSDQSNLLGSALINDVVAAIAVVSRTMDIDAGETLTLNEVAEECGVSQRTINRLRHEGLPFVWVTEPSSKRRLGCKKTQLIEFKKAREGRLEHASTFSRLSELEKEKIVEFALKYQGQGKTINEVANELKEESCRGLETIRSILKSDVKVSNALPLKQPLTRQDARDIEQAIQRGVPWNALATQYKRTKNAMRGALARLRRDRLNRLSIEVVELPVFAMKGAREVLLSPDIVRNCLPPITELNIFEIDESATALSKQDETAIVAAMYVLRRNVREYMSAIQYTPTEAELDAIESDLRWAWLLQQSLILSALPVALSVATQHAGRMLTELPPSKLQFYVDKAMTLTEKICSTIDPQSNQTVAKLTAFTVDRSFSNIEVEQAPAKATARLKPAAHLHSFYKQIQWAVILPEMEVSDAESISPLHGEVFRQKFGWCGYPKRTVELPELLGASHNAIARALRVLH